MKLTNETLKKLKSLDRFENKKRKAFSEWEAIPTVGEIATLNSNKVRQKVSKDRGWFYENLSSDAFAMGVIPTPHWPPEYTEQAASPGDCAWYGAQKYQWDGATWTKLPRPDDNEIVEG